MQGLAVDACVAHLPGLSAHQGLSDTVLRVVWGLLRLIQRLLDVLGSNASTAAARPQSTAEVRSLAQGAADSR